MKRIALITSGGDSPGMNACVRAVVKFGLDKNISCLGIEDGFQGMIDGRGRTLTYDDVNNIVHRGGTILGTARCEAFKTKEGRQAAITFLRKERVDGLIVIGGDGSFTGAQILSKEMEIPVIGIPGTIDNDIFGTDYTIGFDTALNTVVEAIDRIRDTANSHHRVFFIEVMGRDAGFIALNAALASGAESVLIPEELTNLDELVSDIKESGSTRGTIVLVAEGDDAGGAMDIMNSVKPQLGGYDLRCTILGHIQRGGTPSVLDRIIAARMGAHAVQLLIDGFGGLMVGVKGEELITHALEDGIKQHAKPDLTKLELIHALRTKKKMMR